MSDQISQSELQEAIRVVAVEPSLIAVRQELAAFTAKTFRDVGTELHVFGHLMGPDRKSGASPYGHGDDAAVAVSLLLRIGSQLVSGSADLIADGRHYAGSALVRQLVEIEYLAWAFETGNEEARRWLRSDQDQRKSFFTPAKLRKAADGRFRSVDYGHHCEMGGHPVPDSWRLLIDDRAVAQLMLSDCLGHAGHIWDHVAGWSSDYFLGKIIASRSDEMRARYSAWKRADALTALPPPPPA